MLRNSLISWHKKKQSCLTLSITEAKNIAIKSYFTQILWLNQQLLNYGLKLDKIPLK